MTNIVTCQRMILRGERIFSGWADAFLKLFESFNRTSVLSTPRKTWSETKRDLTLTDCDQLEIILCNNGCYVIRDMKENSVLIRDLDLHSMANWGTCFNI